MERKLKVKLPNGIFAGVTPHRSRMMAAVRGKHNKSTEIALRMLLVRSKIDGWTLHPSDVSGKPDIYFPSVKLAVFVDGCFWHGCRRCGHIPKTRTAFWRAKILRNIQRDKANKRLLKRRGIAVLRVWEHSLKNKRDKLQIAEKIRKLVP